MRTKEKYNSSRSLTKKLKPEQFSAAKTRLIEGLKSAFDSESIVEKVWQDLLPTMEAGERKVKTTKESRELYLKAITVYGLDNHSPLSQTVEKEYQPLVVEFSRQLLLDYDCQTAGEKALAEVVVSAYARILSCSRRLNSSFSESVAISENHRGYYSILSKELDRANRQFTTALSMLVQMKKPSLEINIKAKTAYVAQQQLNVTQPNTNNHEIIEAK